MIGRSSWITLETLKAITSNLLRGMWCELSRRHQMGHGDAGRPWRDVAMNQGMPAAARIWGRHGMDPLQELVVGAWLRRPLGWASRH